MGTTNTWVVYVPVGSTPRQSPPSGLVQSRPEGGVADRDGSAPRGEGDAAREPVPPRATAPSRPSRGARHSKERDISEPPMRGPRLAPARRDGSVLSITSPVEEGTGKKQRSWRPSPTSHRLAVRGPAARVRGPRAAGHQHLGRRDRGLRRLDRGCLACDVGVAGCARGRAAARIAARSGVGGHPQGWGAGTPQLKWFSLTPGSSIRVWTLEPSASMRQAPSSPEWRHPTTIRVPSGE